MVSNPGYFSQMASGGALTQVEDGVDNPHTGLIKALSLGMGGNYPISGFDATSVTATTATIANGVIFRDGSKVSITGGGITLSTTYTTGYHLLVARASGIVLINPTAVDKVPEYASGDVVIGIFAHTGTNPMSIQYLSIDKTENSLSIGYDNSGYTEAGTITGDANGVTITGLFKLDTLPTTTPATGDKVIIQDTDDADKIKTITTQQIRDLAPTTPETLQTVTDSGATTTNSITANSFVKTGGASSEFLKADGSVDSNVYLTTESDTLDSVTTRGNTTTNGIGVGDFAGAGTMVNSSLEANSTNFGIGFTLSHRYYYANEASGILILDAGADGQVITIKNMNANTLLLQGNSPSVYIEGNIASSADPRYTGPSLITLPQYESITLQYVLDTGTISPSWYIHNTDLKGPSGTVSLVYAATNASATSINNTTHTNIPLGTASIGVTSPITGYSGASNGFIVIESGTYIVEVRVSLSGWGATTSNFYQSRWVLNGALQNWDAGGEIVGGNGRTLRQVVTLSPGNELGVTTYQNSGSAKNTNTAEMLVFRIN